MIKHSDPSLQKKLLSIFNLIFTSGTFPDSWRVATVIPIPKPNKDHSNPLNFRPISLTSCLCKLLEKIINCRLMWYLEKNHCLSNSQSGFRKGRSTTDCLVKLTSDLQEAVIQNKHTIVVFFDIMKAYDTAWKHGILMKLHQFGLEGNLPIFIQNFLMNRKIQVRVRSTTSSTMAINEGVPQGSVLSCSLFAIAIDHVIRALPPSVKATLYVDDLTIYASGSKSMAERQIQTAINKLTAWCNKSGFQFSASKTVCMHACRQRDGMIWCQNPSPELKLGKEIIPTKSAHTYLGVIIDQRLKWDKHIEYIKNDCKRRMTLFVFSSRYTKPSSFQKLNMVSKLMVQPVLQH